jgi:hypothetical protein
MRNTARLFVASSSVWNVPFHFGFPLCEMRATVGLVAMIMLTVD